MKIHKQHIRAFAEQYKEQFGIIISDEEARSMMEIHHMVEKMWNHPTLPKPLISYRNNHA